MSSTQIIVRQDGVEVCNRTAYQTTNDRYQVIDHLTEAEWDIIFKRPTEGPNSLAKAMLTKKGKLPCL